MWWRDRRREVDVLLDAIVRAMDSPYMPITILFILTLFILTALLMGSHGRERRMADKLNDMRRDIGEKLDVGASVRAREEAALNIRNMGDSIARVMGEMADENERRLTEIRDMIGGAVGGDDVAARLDEYSAQVDGLIAALDEGGRDAGLAQERTLEQLARMAADTDRRMDELKRALEERSSSQADNYLMEGFRQVGEGLDRALEELAGIRALAASAGPAEAESPAAVVPDSQAEAPEREPDLRPEPISYELEIRSIEAGRALDSVRRDLSVLAAAVARTQKRLRQATEAIDEAAKKSRSLEKRLKKLRQREGDYGADVGEPGEEYGNADWD